MGVGAAWGTVWGYAEVVGPDGRPVASDGLPAVGAAWTPDATITEGHAPGGPHEVAVDVTTARQSTLRRVPPMVAIEGEGGLGDDSLVRRVWGAMAGGLVALAAGLFTAIPGALIAVGLGVGAVLVGLALLAPLAAGPVARVVGMPLVRILGEPGLLGRENALRSPRRTAATASALVIGIGLMGVVGVLGATCCWCRA